MEFESRKKLIDLLKKVERDYPIDKWLHNGINLWPVIKISIFFINYNAVKTAPKVSAKTKLLGVFRLLKFDVLYACYWFKKLHLKKSKYIFAGFSRHRVMWHDAFYNRYFDPVMDYLEKDKKEVTSFFEYDKPLNKQYYKPGRIHFVIKMIHYFKFKTKPVKLNYAGFPQFNDLLNLLKSETEIDAGKLLKRIDSELTNVYAWKALWKHVLKQTDARYAFMLCYYNSPMYGLILAAKEQNVVSIDMQHGGQGAFHSAYNYISVRGERYDLLPDYFWSWDRSSSDNINAFIKGTKHHDVLGGNPWIQHLKGQDITLDKSDKKIILYTMQTNFVPVLHQYVIDGIKNTPDNYIWWLRLHPRMTEAEISELNETLTKADIRAKVEIEKASELPLPVILSKCVAHVSHFSGSVVEAALMNVPVNIVMGDIGKKFFEEILEQGEAIFYDPDHDVNLFSFVQRLEAEAGARSTITNTSEPDFRMVLNEFK